MKPSNANTETPTKKLISTAASIGFENQSMTGA